MKAPLAVHQPGDVPYPLAHDWQKQRLQAMSAQALPDGLLLLTHPPIYTLGQGATESFLKFLPDQAPHPVQRVERGGEVTYHGPGQWVGYPILDLRRHQQDLHWYLRQLEAVMILTLANLGLPGERLPGLTGVWLEGAKVGAVGIRVTRWLTWHGFSLNVAVDLAAYEGIVPCGIGDRPVGSLHQWLPTITLNQVAPLIIGAIAECFDLTPQAVDLPTWLGQG